MEKVNPFRLEQLFENVQLSEEQQKLHNQALAILDKQAKKRLKEIKEFIKFNE